MVHVLFIFYFESFGVALMRSGEKNMKDMKKMKKLKKKYLGFREVPRQRIGRRNGNIKEECYNKRS